MLTMTMTVEENKENLLQITPVNPRKFLVVGNWKMNGDKNSINELVSQLNKWADDRKESTDIVVAPSTIYLDYVKQRLSDNIHIAAQNCYKVTSGAFTGETSVHMLKDMGVEWVIIGHLERRYVFGESDALIADKIQYALQAGLRVILCIGERLEEREAGLWRQVIQRQLQSIIDKNIDWQRVVIAYEALSAEGAASAEYVQQVHEWIRRILRERLPLGDATVNGECGAKVIPDSIRVIYGGCVTGENCGALASQPDIDGFLVGSAFLKPDFSRIIASRNGFKMHG